MLSSVVLIILAFMEAVVTVYEFILICRAVQGRPGKAKERCHRVPALLLFN